MMTFAVEAGHRAAQRLISSRMLILQSKRLMLASSQRRLQNGQPELSDRVAHLTLEASLAQHSFRSTVLECGPDASSQYWPVAYSRLVEVGEVLTTQLRGAAPNMSAAADRYAMATEVEALEGFIKGWRNTLQKSMTPAEG